MAATKATDSDYITLNEFTVPATKENEIDYIALGTCPVLADKGTDRDNTVHTSFTASWKKGHLKDSVKLSVFLLAV